jgi:hypothetical protein
MDQNIDDFRKRLAGNDRDPVADLRKFIGIFWGSDLENDTITRLMTSMPTGKSSLISKGIAAGNKILAERCYDDELVQIVLWEANVPIEEPLADAARNWLKEKLEWTEALVETKK